MQTGQSGSIAQCQLFYVSSALLIFCVLPHQINLIKQKQKLISECFAISTVAYRQKTDTREEETREEERQAEGEREKLYGN